MREHLSTARAAQLGGFVCIALALGALGLFSVGRHGGLFAASFTLRAQFPAIGGVTEGTRVRVQGVDAGIVSRIVPPQQPGEPVLLHLQVSERFRGLVRKDARAQLATQGIVGGRVVEIVPGGAQSPAAEDGDLIAVVAPIELSQLLADAQQAGQELRVLGAKVAGAVERIDRLVARVEQGEGTVGKLVMTDEAHRAALDLMHVGDQVLTKLDETAMAARRVWPLRDHFINQGMSTPDDLLFRPGQRREVQELPAADLFQPGTSALSDAGKARLNAVADWLNANKQAASEVVIAAFDPQEAVALKAQRLTQEQATAVQTYLINQHAVNRLGIFSRRSILAAGFGNHRPAPPDGAPAKSPTSRVEVIIFFPIP
jgi:phospholipid/cholesterol/gamma-HCH transport system substrate-binding protein